MSEQHFRDHMLALRERWDCVRLCDVSGLAPSRRGSSRPLVAVTFDDGYADNFSKALPILEEAGVPATVFVTVDNMNSGEPYWWDALATALLGEDVSVPCIRLSASGRCWMQDTAADARRRTYDELQAFLKALPAAEVHDILGQVIRQLGADPSAPAADGLPMSRGQVAKLAASPLIDIGSHGLSHTDLGAVTRSQVAEEAFVAKKVLERVAGRPVVAFSYPFGSCGETATRAVQESGYEVACAIGGGAVRATSDRYRYGRLLVRDWPIDTLEASMHRYLLT